jgi:thiosulfate/3-mercaptopyruvate sulfurtransferase
LSKDELETERLCQDKNYQLVDARTNARYLGQNETVDPVAGHIPGALNFPYSDNLTAEGKFKTKDELRILYRNLITDIPITNTVFYCGSGVTATVNILALYHAGIGEAPLYAGSWSEWITDPHRPIETENLVKPIDRRM